jgi:hypothetical protein
LSLSGKAASRRDLGLPADWDIVEQWLHNDSLALLPACGTSEPKKCKWDLPILKDYSVAADSSFWLKFPKRELPSSPETKINVSELEKKVIRLSDKMTCHQFARAKKAIDYLRHGAPSFQRGFLPACFVKNAKSTIIHGAQVTENIATWIAEGYAAGPFDGPPCKNFRVNPLLAVVQPDKVRPVLNVSSPHKASFNSSVDPLETESIKMASAKKYGQLLLDCGQNATMSKHDLVAAYKQIPCRIEDLRLQGFCWLGKYFVETRQIFGAKTSVCNYNILGETLKLLALLESQVPQKLVLRQVDDVPSASPQGTGLCERFSMVYRNLCSELNVELAPNCPNNDKAFENQCRGKVLGVMFDSSDLTWRLADKKLSKTAACVNNAITSDTSTLKEWQCLLGRVNDISQMCPFMSIFRKPLTDMLADISSEAPSDTILMITSDAKKVLFVWAGFLNSDLKWLPICPIDQPTPVKCKEFVSDAAGLAKEADIRTSPGCGNIGFCENGKIIFANQFVWPRKFIETMVDSKGSRFGDKTTTLEAIGVLIPFILVPELLAGQHVLLRVDCFGTIYGFMNKVSKGDETASLFIRAVHLIAAYLSCAMHIDHLPRMSDFGAEVSDRLSRISSSTLQDRKLIRAFHNRQMPVCLLEWFNEPKVDWELPYKLLCHVKNLV